MDGGIADNGSKEIEWEGELDCTDADMLDAVCTVATKEIEPYYTGKGAFTIPEMVEHSKRGGKPMSITKMRDLVMEKVKSGELIQVSVYRIGSSNKRYRAYAYIIPEVFEREMVEK